MLKGHCRSKRVQLQWFVVDVVLVVLVSSIYRSYGFCGSCDLAKPLLLLRLLGFTGQRPTLQNDPVQILYGS
jgi:hypothetical protein